MKSFATCLLVVVAVASIAYAFPARSDSKSDPSNDAEFIVVPLEHQRPSYISHRYPATFEDFDGVLDTDDFPHPDGQSPVFFPSINPFTWQFSSYLDDIIKRVRDRFAGSWNPFYGGGGDFIPSGPGLFPIDIPDVDSAEGGQTNSTSTVKVIDGHKVIINDTYYTKKTDFGTSVFKVRVIDVQPADDGDDDKSATTTEKSIETGNRNGGADDAESPKKDSDDEDKKAEPTTAETPKRDTELDSSDEEASPAGADDNLNTIDDSKTKDIDGDKKDTEVNTEADGDDSATTSAPAA